MNHQNINDCEREKKNSKLHKDTLETTLDKLSRILNEKKTERKIISNEIDLLVEKENSYFQNKKVLNDMINLLQKYRINLDFRHSNSSIGEDKNENFNKLISIFKAIYDSSFLNIFDSYKNLASLKDSETILLESRNEIEKKKEEFEKSSVNSSEEPKNKSFKTFKKLIEHKFNIINEQNTMINCLINYFNSIPGDILNQFYQHYHCESKTDENQKSKCFVKSFFEINIGIKKDHRKKRRNL